MVHYSHIYEVYQYVQNWKMFYEDYINNCMLLTPVSSYYLYMDVFVICYMIGSVIDFLQISLIIYVCLVHTNRYQGTPVRVWYSTNRHFEYRFVFDFSKQRVLLNTIHRCVCFNLCLRNNEFIYIHVWLKDSAWCVWLK